ncbi:MAG: MCE family protein, partial [Deltaproteobacteria bacterium]
ISFEIVDDTRGQTTRTSTIHTSTNPNDPHEWRTTQETTADAIRFSLQIARRLGPLTFRFGIKESTGGAGIDLHLFRDTLELRTDIFDFSTSALPRLRVALAYEIVRRAWLIGGVDDILNGPRTDYYLGAMLRFNDEDMRSILLFAGGLLGSVAR